MNSKERILAALHRQPVDHLPLLLRFWPMGEGVDRIPFEWKDEIQRVQNMLALGLDDTILLQPPLGYVEEYIPEKVPGVASHVEQLSSSGEERYPLLKKVYETPEGPLQTVIRQTEDWPRGMDIRLFDDHNISRLAEPLVKTHEDLPRLRALLANPSPEQVEAFRNRADYLRCQAEALGVVLEGGWSALGDAAVWLAGMERILYGQVDEPEFLDELLETVFQWELRRMEAVLTEGVDVWVHMAWYEGSDFWTPKVFRKLLKPRLAELVARAHAHGLPFRYIITKGWKPVRKDLLEIGIDCITGVDPVQDAVDLEEVKHEIGGQVCLMGGVNSGIMLSEWSEAEIRQAVDRAVEILAPGGGFILYPVDAVFDNQPWEKVEALIDEWRKVCNR